MLRIGPWLLLLAAAPVLAAPRSPWNGSRIVGTPDPGPPFRAEPLYPALRFTKPIEVVSAPGSARLFVAELGGRIVSVPYRPGATASAPFCDVSTLSPGFDRLLGLTFHPRFAENRLFYVVVAQKGGTPDGSRVTELRATRDDPPRCDPAHARVLLTWTSGGHNGGSLQFAPDGTLFISTGDGAEPFPPDHLEVGQTLGDLMSAILRIDVDRPSGGRAYGVPADNPFVNMKGARPEIWAYGLRNPWRISVDAPTGDLWAADVGWETWEMVYRIERGANYGWSVMEGPLKVRPDAPLGPTPIVPPLLVHPHSESRSITGGHVYRGGALPELVGAYVYGDYDTGKVWGVRAGAQPRTVAWKGELADTRLNIVSFGTAPDGELLLLDYGSGSGERTVGEHSAVYKLVRNADARANTRFPRRLSATGLFRVVSAQAPATGVLPYQINAQPWADGATMRRWVALPRRTQVDTAGPWKYPEGAVLVRSFSLGARPVETQLLHFDGHDWRGYTYRWDDRGRDATLVPAAGAEATFTVKGRRVAWRYGSRSECATCHAARAGTVLGFTPASLGHSLKRLDDAGLFTQPPALAAHTLADPNDTTATLTARARAYLHVNCAHCHRPEAGSLAALHLPFDLPLEKTGIVGGKPMQGSFGLDQAAVVAPGAPERSTLFYRLATVGAGRMPRLGARTSDLAGLGLIEAWIGSLGAAAPRPPGDPLASPSLALRAARAIDRGDVSGPERDQLVARGVAHDRPEIRGLFERFLPEEQRVPRLGESFDPALVLSRTGDAARGRKLFLEGSAGCIGCHRVGDRGGALGPPLDQLGRRANRELILESVVAPSKQVDPRYQWYVVETKDGRSHAGLLVARTTSELGLLDASGITTKIPMSEVKIMLAQERSPMPEGLLGAMTAQDAADLLAFLAALK